MLKTSSRCSSLPQREPWMNQPGELIHAIPHVTKLAGKLESLRLLLVVLIHSGVSPCCREPIGSLTFWSNPSGPKARDPFTGRKKGTSHHELVTSGFSDLHDPHWQTAGQVRPSILCAVVCLFACLFVGLFVWLVGCLFFGGEVPR